MARTARKLNAILIKPAGPDCNLSCTYCFYLDKADLFKQESTHRMTPQIQEEVIRQAMQQSGDQLSITWQGGEPTLMGLDFYKRAIELEMQYGHGQMVGNGLQTNGVLLNQEWAHFLKEYNWLVGLSLDGPANIHNNYRINKAGNATHRIVEENAKMLIDHGIAVNAMSCVTSHSAEFASELYYYYKELGFDFMQFIPVVEPDKKHPQQAASFSVTSEQYGRFLCELFDLWISDFVNSEPTTNIRHFESIFHTYVGLDAPECTFMKECAPYVVVEHNGNVYSCDFFVEPKWKLGNVKYDQLSSMLNSKTQDNFGKAKNSLSADCRKCKWLRSCYGGCTKDRIKDPQDNRKPRFCQSYRMFFEHADERLTKLAENWHLKQTKVPDQHLPNDTYNAFDDFVK